MVLSPGTRFGSYEIIAPIGAGGMGEVYRATDTKLGREVAIKALAVQFARNAEQLARFEREARLLASLNHPNIAAIYGLEQIDGMPVLVLELVPGPTLAQQLASGPLEVREALRICAQITEALEAAHEKGIVHRDLKPANVKITPEGKVKVLDFGLAKAFAEELLSGDPTLSPTVSFTETRVGTILGTAPYMSPEQARGRPLDKRTDIWSFGCVLYEALAGRKPFDGETVSDAIAAILGREPDWNLLPSSTPERVQELLRRCLEKDHRHRLRDIGDARIALEDVLNLSITRTTPFSAITRAPRRRGRPALLWIVAALLAITSAAALWNLWRSNSAPQALVRTAIPLPSEDRFNLFLGTLAVSPDGKQIVYAATRAAQTQLYLRHMDQFDTTAMPGTESAFGPFFSPDGKWVGFFAAGKLKKVALDGGIPVTLCDAPAGRGATWGPDDTIIFSPSNMPGTGLLSIPAAGGTPQVVTRPDTKKGEVNHRWPEILPGGKGVVFTIETNTLDFDDANIQAASLQTGARRELIKGGSYARYVRDPAGGKAYLVYGRLEGLMAAPFDESRLELTGQPVPVLEGAAFDAGSGAGHFAFSQSGSLFYVPGGSRVSEAELVWVDQKGSASPVTPRRGAYSTMRLSPDGSQLAVTMLENARRDIWILDVARGVLTRLTSDGNIQGAPLWTPDGKRLTFAIKDGGSWRIVSRSVDGSGPQEVLSSSEKPRFPTSWSRDGNWLAFYERAPATASDIWVLPMQGDRTPRPFVLTPFIEDEAVFSPDGHWLAYVSRESGDFQVYLQPFPGPGGRRQISTQGGWGPAWARDGRRLFYRSGDKVLAVEVKLTPALEAGKPQVLFERPVFGLAAINPSLTYDVAPDGRFIMIQRGGAEASTNRFHVVLNYLDEMKQRLGQGKK